MHNIDYNPIKYRAEKHMNDIREIDQMPAGGNEDLRQPARLPYESPSVKCDRLSLITRGGTVGGGDSGDSGSEQPLSPSVAAERESQPPRM